MPARITTSSLIVGLKGDLPEAWERLYRDYWPVVYAFAYSHTGSVQDAEDLTQETFAVVSEKVEDFVRRPGRPGFRAWLRAICMIHVLNYRKTKRRQPLPADVREAEDTDAPGPEAQWERSWYGNLYQMATRRLFRELSRTERGIEQYTAFGFRCRDGMGYDEIMRYLNARRERGAPKANYHAVKNYVHRTKQLLRSHIEASIREYCKTDQEFKEELSAFRRYVTGKKALP